MAARRLGQAPDSRSCYEFLEMNDDPVTIHRLCTRHPKQESTRHPRGPHFSKARALIAGAPLNSKNLAATKTVGL